MDRAESSCAWAYGFQCQPAESPSRVGPSGRSGAVHGEFGGTGACGSGSDSESRAVFFVVCFFFWGGGRFCFLGGSLWSVVELRSLALWGFGVIFKTHSSKYPPQAFTCLSLNFGVSG